MAKSAWATLRLHLGSQILPCIPLHLSPNGLLQLPTKKKKKKRILLKKKFFLQPSSSFGSNSTTSCHSRSFSMTVRSDSQEKDPDWLSPPLGSGSRPTGPTGCSSEKQRPVEGSLGGTESGGRVSVTETMTGSSPHGSTIINGVHLSDTYAELGTRVFNLVLNSRHLSIRLAK